MKVIKNECFILGCDAGHVASCHSHIGFTFAEKPDAKDVRTLNAMHKALLDGSWLGDIDSWETHLPHHIWQQVQSDKHSCIKHQAEHTHCPFHKARDTMDEADGLYISQFVVELRDVFFDLIN